MRITGHLGPSIKFSGKCVNQDFGIRIGCISLTRKISMNRFARLTNEFLRKISSVPTLVEQKELVIESEAIFTHRDLCK
jgi:hypothetical protein